jgi:hypothetical protein
MCLHKCVHIGNHIYVSHIRIYEKSDKPCPGVNISRKQVHQYLKYISIQKCGSDRAMNFWLPLEKEGREINSLL